MINYKGHSVHNAAKQEINGGKKDAKQLENVRDSPKKLGHKNLNIKNQYN